MSKAIEVKINCDSCNADLSPHVTSYPNHYILKVSVEDIAISSGCVVYAIYINPPINQDLYFCGLACMKNYDKPKGKE